MNWVERLNQQSGRVFLGDAPLTARPASGLIVDIKNWNYSPHLPDNVRHRHAYFEVCLVGGWGHGEYIVEGKGQAIGPGDLFFSRPGVLHQIINHDPIAMELFWIAFHTTLSEEDTGSLPALFHRFANAEDVLVTPDRGGAVRVGWEALRAAAESAGPAFGARATALMQALLIGIAEAGSGIDREEAALPPGPASGDDIGQAAVRYIHENLGRAFRVVDIADALAVSPRHLTRVFVRFAGVAPATYVEAARIQRARTLLLRTDDPLKQVAAQVGYEDIHHFTHVFQRVVGCPPGRYRKTDGAAATPVAVGPELRDPGALV